MRRCKRGSIRLYVGKRRCASDRAQGSEWDYMVFVLSQSHYMMLQRNLLYTALTRARKLCVLVGDKRAIGRSVKNNKATRRFTRLAERLKD